MPVARAAAGPPGPRAARGAAMTYQEACDFLLSLLAARPPGPTPYALQRLQRMRHLCGLLGNPERGFPAVLVAGTKGKGSTAAMIAAAVQAAGYRVGLYTKPHLVDVRERFQINGALIPPDEFARRVDEIRTAIARGEGGPGWPPSYFEAAAALAFVHFTRQAVDLGVIEVGIGGRLDATNVVDPRVSVITTIGYDHTELVGTRMRQIASEDVGIMRPSGRVVAVPQAPAAAAVIEEAARAVGAALVRVGREIRYRTRLVSPAGTRFTVRTPRQTYRDLSVQLLGRHQAQNAAAAIGVVEALGPEGFDVQEVAIRAGLADLRWPARIEVVRQHPLVIVDVAHNVVSFRALRAVLDEVFGAHRLLLVIGLLGSKDLAGIADVIGPRAAVLIATRAQDPRAIPAADVAAVFRGLVPEVRVVEDPIDAVDEALRIASPEDLVCAAGSFHVAGPVRVHLLGLSAAPEGALARMSVSPSP
ncbi:MAG: bifunctional folylpolyglutamate synthase/dihydrofolate synthase [Armatimonadetes bacterium]|nr:bifunctional folylpolyglutamate synthase/dihydrofolate synthase [Armatimonadota bacterium]